MILAVEAMLILLAGAVVCVLTDVVSKRVASHSVPELQLLPSEADQTALLEDVGMMLTPSRLERYVGAIGLYALGGAALWIQTPFWLIGVVVVALIPCIAAVRYLTTRHRLRQLIRQKLVEAGIAVCVHCGCTLPNHMEASCPRCGGPIEHNAGGVERSK